MKKISIIAGIQDLETRTSAVLDKRKVTQQFLYEYENLERYKKGTDIILRRFLKSKAAFLIGTRRILAIAKECEVRMDYEHPEHDYLAHITPLCMDPK
jgi:hypothetical protein